MTLTRLEGDVAIVEAHIERCLEKKAAMESELQRTLALLSHDNL